MNNIINFYKLVKLYVTSYVSREKFTKKKTYMQLHRPLNLQQQVDARARLEVERVVARIVRRAVISRNSSCLEANLLSLDSRNSHLLVKQQLMRSFAREVYQSEGLSRTNSAASYRQIHRVDVLRSNILRWFEISNVTQSPSLVL